VAKAICDGREDVALELLKVPAGGTPVDVAAEDEDGMTLLCSAAGRGVPAVVRRLLALGAAAAGGACDEHGNTALHRAVMAGSLADVEALLGAGADPGEPRSDGTTALTSAAGSGHDGIVSAMLSTGRCGDVSAVRGYVGDAPLHAAARSGSVRAMAALVGAGADAGARNRGGLTVLMCAASGGSAAAVDAVLSWRPRADVNAADLSGSATALHLAAESGSGGAVRALAAAGASAGAADAECRWTVLGSAAMSGSDGAVLAVLGACGGDASATIDRPDGGTGLPALHVAAASGMAAAVRAMVAAGADASLRAADDLGSTPLMLAASDETAAALLESGACGDVDATDARGMTALMRLAEAGAGAGAVTGLLEAGADASASTAAGVTALHLMAQSGRAGPMGALLCSERFHGDVDAVASGGMTPLVLAVAASMSRHRAPSPAVVRLLLEHGADPAAVFLPRPDGPGGWPGEAVRLVAEAAAAGPGRVRGQRGWHRAHRRLRLVLWRRAVTDNRATATA